MESDKGDPRGLTPSIARAIAIAENKQLYHEALADILERAEDGWFCASLECDLRDMAERLAHVLTSEGWKAFPVQRGAEHMVKVEW